MLRRYTFKLYPNAAQEAALREQARLCAVLWNALLEMRETHYRRAKQRGEKKTSLTAFDQGKDITALNAAAKTDPELAEWRAIPRGTQERVADMLDLAFKAFFKRAKGGAGASSGYPRYKSTRHAENIPLREPVKSCWKFEPKGSDGECLSDDFPKAEERKHTSKAKACEKPGAGALRTEGGDKDDRRVQWRLTLRGIPGKIKARGKFPVTPTGLKTADVKYHGGGWWFSICVDIPERMTHGGQKLTVEFDLIDAFASVKLADGRCAPGLSDPFSSGRKGEFPSNEGGLQESPCGEPLFEGGAGVVLADRIQSERDRRYKRGSYRWRKEKARIAKIKAKEARQRKEALHRWSTEIVRVAKEVEIIAPPQRAMRSAKGNEQFPGAEVKTVAALNRHVLAMAPAAAIQMLEYKAKEARIACAVTRRADHQVLVGGELKAAAIANRRAKRVTKRKQKLQEAAE